ncbi:hypothetical protein CPJCM30710_05410 [Clostridium polyendosporum]|uniref:SHSP domain-containing protein n=1 Tax=Clostridium polyendosporum TaxID=69208 RepID=A0A919RWQ9_9CLOT|nr:Hsp20 family protein [Clostridium polyendosporum]GIM27875.1 hypothetical protein CPJCM30710_05410 [Clostridium polyendosporum]
MFGLLKIINELSSNNIDLNMNELDDKYLIYGKLQGVKRNNISINYNNNHLIITVKVNRVANNSLMGNVFIVQQSSNISKSFYVPNVDITRITGSFDGLNLVINVPKIINSMNDKLIVDVETYMLE